MKTTVAIILALALSALTSLPTIAAEASLGIFTDDALKTVYIEGETMEFIIVFKTSVPFDGGTGSLRFAMDGAKDAHATTFKVPAMNRGKHIEVFRIDNTLWKPGTYMFDAVLGDLTANRLKIEVIGRTRETNFGLVDVGFWGSTPAAYRGARYTPFASAQVNLVISAGTAVPAPLKEVPLGGYDWVAEERILARLKEDWGKDMTKPAFELHPERHRSKDALSNDDALRALVNTSNKPFIIDDRTWMGVISFHAATKGYGTRVLNYTARHARYQNYLGILYNDDPMLYWGPGYTDSVPRWSHLAPVGGADFQSAGRLEPTKRLHDGRVIFKGNMFGLGNKPINLFFRKPINFPFKPKQVLIEFYQADRLWFWVNGKRTGFISWGTKPTNFFDITDKCKKGDNLFAIESRNVGWIGFMGCTIRAIDPSGKNHDFYSDLTWKMFDPKVDSERKLLDTGIPTDNGGSNSSSIEGVPAGPGISHGRDYRWVGPDFDDSDWQKPKPFPEFGKDGKLVHAKSVAQLKPELNAITAKSRSEAAAWDTVADLTQFYRLVSDAMYKIDSGLRHTTNHGLYWGPRTGEYTPSQYRALDYGVSVLYTDQGEYPLSDSLDAERFKRGMKPGTMPWIGMANFPARNNVWMRGIRTIGRKVGGIGFFNGGGGIHSYRGWQTNTGIDRWWEEGRRYSMETLLLAGRAYGDTLIDLVEDDKVAWLGTWTEETTSGGYQWGRPWQFYHMAEAHYSLMRAHFPMNVFEERELLEDRLTLDRAKVLLIATRSMPLPEEVINKIKAFMQKGGKVIVTKCASAVNIPGAIKLDIDMTKGMQVHNMPQWDGTREYKKPEARFIAYKDELRKALYSAVTPFVDADSMWVTMSVQRYGQGKYVFVVNDRFPPFYHEKRTGNEHGAVGARSGFAWRMLYTMPAEHTLYFKTSDGDLPEGYVIYDLFAQEQLTLKDPDPDAKGWKAGKRRLDMHFVNNPARILVCLPKPIDTLSLAVSPTVKRGELLRTKVRVLDADGDPIDALFPVEIWIMDPSGTPRYHVWRTGGPDEERMYKIAVNDIPGDWTIYVKELVSGAISSKKFKVLDAMTEALTVTRDTDQVLVYDEHQVWNMVRNRGDDGPIYIVISKEQDRFWKLANTLKNALAEIGTRAKVVTFNRGESEGSMHQFDFNIDRYVLNGAMAWDGGSSFNWPVIYRNVISLSTSKRVARKIDNKGKNSATVYEEENETRPGTTRGGTPNYPGPGWAIIQFTPSPFSFSYDVVNVLGHDDDGLEYGVRELIRIARKKSVAAKISTRLNFDPEGPVVGGNVLRARMKPTAQEPTTDGQGQGRRVENFIDKRFGVPLRGAAISPDGETIAVGTDGYGENLFVYNRKGKLRWKKKVGVMNVQFIDFSKDSKKLQCSSNVFGALSGPESARIAQYDIENTSVYDVKTGAREQFLFGMKDPLGVREKRVKADSWAVPEGYSKDKDVLTRTLDGEPMWEYQTFKNQPIQHIAVTKNGKWIAFSAWSSSPWLGGDPILVLLNAANGKRVWYKKTDGVQPGHSELALLESGVMLLTDHDGEGRPMFNLLNHKDGSTIYSYTGQPGGGGGLPFKIGPGGEWIVVQVGGSNPHIRLVYMDAKKQDAIFYFENEVNQQEFTPDNSKLLVGLWGGMVTTLDMNTGRPIWQTTVQGDGPRVMFSKDLKNVLVTCFTGQVSYLDADTGEILWTADLNAAEAAPGLYDKCIKWMDENTNDALDSGHNINGNWHQIEDDVEYLP